MEVQCRVSVRGGALSPVHIAQATAEGVRRVYYKPRHKPRSRWGDAAATRFVDTRKIEFACRLANRQETAESELVRGHDREALTELHEMAKRGPL